MWDLEIKKLQVKLANATADSEKVRTQIETLETNIRQQESKIAAEGGIYAQNMANLRHQQEQFQTVIQDLENKIRVQCGELFPFALVPENLKRLRVRVEKERQLDEWEAKNRALEAHNSILLQISSFRGILGLE